MDYLPLFMKLAGQPCLVVGGGPIARRKVELLRSVGAAVTVVAPSITADMGRWAAAGEIQWREKSFEPHDLDGYRLVIGATDLREVNESVCRAALEANIPVNVVDCPELCSFIFPAIVDRSPVVAAVSSGGVSPVLSRLLKAKLESAIPFGYGHLAELAGRVRRVVKTAIPDGSARREFWEKVLRGPVAELAMSGRTREAEELLQREIAAAGAVNGIGMVYLVGAGPGDPELLTLRAFRLIQEADVVVYDRLVSPEIMGLVRRDAEKIYAGKQRSQHTLPQEDINRLLADLAMAGKRVVRLKGGDPFIFGRGGEEIETLMEQGIHFQVVPGITAASGCAAYAGIPLTHRDYAQSVTFVTGHLRQGEVTELDWGRLAAPRQTVVVYMGLQGLPQICAALLAHGSSPELPAALVQQGTTANQAVIAGTLATLPDLVEGQSIKAPTLAIIGEVVRLHGKLAWFGRG
ncbi:MAG: uroporphyrinogen-III C-methyltransferase [Methylococcaceae bacterium]|nr:uroporphyrinogen-III C-methyltransferase [Methylococcaceae bacterium]